MKKALKRILCKLSFHSNKYIHFVKIDGEEYYETTCQCGKKKRYESADDNVALGYQSP